MVPLFLAVVKFCNTNRLFTKLIMYVYVFEWYAQLVSTAGPMVDTSGVFVAEKTREKLSMFLN